jgi:hypothetical protein
MVAIFTLLLVLTVSLLITRVATVALTHTGLSKQAARFQARSAFTGVGFTTSEAEAVVNHPVRRRILMILMLLGNAGVVTVVASLILTFLDTRQSKHWLAQILLLAAGVAALWMAAMSKWLDRQLSRLIRHMLRRYTHLDVRDYAGLLHLGGDYQVTELHVEPDDWLAGRTLAELRLREEGVNVLGIQNAKGEYLGVPNGDTKVHAGDTLLMYGRDSSFEQLDDRRRDWSGEREHEEAVREHEREIARQKEQEEREEGQASAEQDEDED